MFDRRNIEISTDKLSLGLENMFDTVEDANLIRLYISQIEKLELRQGNGTELCVQIDAHQLDNLAKAWLEKRKR